MLGKYIWLTLREFFKIGLEKEEEEENLLIVRIAWKSRDQKWDRDGSKGLIEQQKIYKKSWISQDKIGNILNMIKDEIDW